MTSPKVTGAVRHDLATGGRHIPTLEAGISPGRDPRGRDSEGLCWGSASRGSVGCTSVRQRGCSGRGVLGRGKGLPWVVTTGGRATDVT